MGIENPQLPLNVLLTKKCNYRCPFCIEDTKRESNGTLEWISLAKTVNQMIDTNLVNTILLLGGEPLYYPHIVQFIESLNVKPIITTNGYRFAKDQGFVEEFARIASKVESINISLSHYSEEKRRELSGTGRSFSNAELKDSLRKIKKNTSLRINTLLIRNYIDSSEEIKKMTDLCKFLGVKTLRVRELIGKDTSITKYVKERIIRFNANSYVHFPPEEYVNEDNEVQVLFDTLLTSLPGAKDGDGKYYQRVLFEDGMIGYSWDREGDGVFDSSELFCQPQVKTKLLL